MPLRQAQLKQIPLFGELSEQELTLVAERARELRYPKGSIVFSEGDQSDYLLIILSGAAKIVLMNSEGEETILDIRRSGSFFGEMALLDGAPRSATVITTESCQLAQISRDAFLELLRANPAMSQKLLVYLTKRLRDETEQVKSLTMFDAYGRVIRCIIALSQQTGHRIAGGVSIPNRPSNQDLARMAGCTRETVSRAMKVLEETGFVKMSRSELLLTDRAIKKYWPAM